VSMKKQIPLVFTILLLASFGSADIYIKTKAHTDGMMGQPATDTISEAWIGDNQFAMVSEERVSVIDLKKNVLYIINHSDKTYVEASLPFDIMKLLPPQAAGMMSGRKMTVTVNPTGGKKTVGQWACDEYELTMAMTMTMGTYTIKSKIYATADLPFDHKAFMEKMGPHFLKLSIMFDQNSAKEMMKIKGLTILKETIKEFMGNSSKSTEEVVEISKKAAPAGIYSVPAGYTKQDTISIPGM
jgi:hypothetical protein